MGLEYEIRAIVRELVVEEVGRALGEQDGAPWMTVEAAAELLGITPAAVHSRLSGGWMRGHTVRDGKRVLIERKALLAELERKRCAGE
jgi:predicted transcriptional regulator